MATNTSATSARAASAAARAGSEPSSYATLPPPPSAEIAAEMASKGAEVCYGTTLPEPPQVGPPRARVKSTKVRPTPYAYGVPFSKAVPPGGLCLSES